MKQDKAAADDAAEKHTKTEPAPTEENSKEIEEIETVEKTQPDADATDQPKGIKKFLRFKLGRKGWLIVLAVAALLGGLFAAPQTRYAILGTFLQESFSIVVVDAKTNKPVSSADVVIGGSKAVTDNKGRATIKAKVGTKTIAVSKKYYKSNNVEALIPVSQKNGPYKITLQATGRQVPIVVIHKITGKPVVNAVVQAADTDAKTDKDGKAVIVLPADKAEVPASISLNGYNKLTANIKVGEQELPENTFSLTPVGKIYFLSKQSGKIDVVKTNLDGGERKIVVAGTGREDGYDTVLLASRDWKYLAFKSKRDGGEQAKLFLIETASDKLTVMDEGKANFNLVGWSEHRFVYTVVRVGVPNTQPKAQALKSYDAPSGKIATIDETEGEGSGNWDYAYNYFQSVYILDNELVYSKAWTASYYLQNRLAGKQVQLISAKPDGSSKKSVKDFAVPAGRSYYSIDLRPYGPNEIYILLPRQTENEKEVFYEYEDGKFVQKNDITLEEFHKEYPTYLESPSGKQVFWSETRDGKNTLFIGNEDAEQSKQIASLSESKPYGWYSDDYLLVSQKSSELYIMPVNGGMPLKITDYHKQGYDLRGYGKGYGGL